MIIKKGTILLDNDPRHNGKRIKVDRVVTRWGEGTEPYAEYKAGVRRAYIRCDRIYSDGKKRRYGWTQLL